MSFLAAILVAVLFSIYLTSDEVNADSEVVNVYTTLDIKSEKRNVSGKFDADLSGAGSVRYSGNPGTVKKDTSGASSVKRLVFWQQQNSFELF